MSNTDLQSLQISATQFLHALAGDTLLPIDLAAPLLGKSPSTLRTDVTRRPQALPVMTRLGGRVFFRKSDIDAHVLNARVAPPARAGRPTKSEQIKKGGHHG